MEVDGAKEIEEVRPFVDGRELNPDSAEYGREDSHNSKDECEPKIGMMFKTVDEAYEFYNRYAYDRGFGIAKKHTRKREGVKYEVTINCCKEGKAKEMQGLHRKKAKISYKTNCQAKMVVRLHCDGLWYVESVVLEHNHRCTPNMARLFYSHKKVSSVVQKQLEYCDRAGVQPCQSFQTLVQHDRGHENLLSTERNCRNYLTKLRHGEVEEGDAQAIVDYFSERMKENLFFFYHIDVDELGRLKHIFWSDARSRASYSYFNDVVIFDTTLTRNYDMPFSPFLGVNHHGFSVLLGAGLLSDEATESYVWLFRSWLTCMNGVSPKAIITDECKAIGNAIAEVFPNSKHRLCIWHILSKVPQKLGGYARYTEIRSRLYDVVYDSLHRAQFEDGWNGMIEEFVLEGNTWLQLLYEERHRWVPAFVNDTFWAGMSSTQRSESMNAVFDKYVLSRTCLKEFVVAYDHALKAKYDTETIDDFASNEKPPLHITRSKLEAQIAQVYTANMFKKFQAELQKGLDCSVLLVKTEGATYVYEVNEDVHEKTYVYEVYFNEDESEIHCVCRKFEFSGILCTHALMVLKAQRIKQIPERYICHRWRKDFKHNCDIALPRTIDAPPNNKLDRYDSLYSLCLHYLPKIVEMGATTSSGYKIVINSLKEMSSKVEELNCKRDGFENQLNGIVTDTNVVENNGANCIPS